MHGGPARNIFVNVLLTYSKQCKQAVNKHVDITVSMAEVEPETKICESFYKKSHFKFIRERLRRQLFKWPPNIHCLVKDISPGWLRLTA